MKNRWLVLAILCGILLAPVLPVYAEDGKTGEPYPGTAICLPDAYLNKPGNCLPLGPSQTLTELAKKGITFPPRPLPAVNPPSELTKSPVQVAKINIEATEAANLYATLEDAVAGSNPIRQIPPGAGLRYVSYIQEARVNGKPFVLLKTGEWMRASPAGYVNFQGLVFQKTPANDFGWMFDHAKARSKPSWNAPEVGETLPARSGHPDIRCSPG